MITDHAYSPVDLAPAAAEKPLRPSLTLGKSLPSGAVPRHAFHFDGAAGFSVASWHDLCADAPNDTGFSWFHVELPPAGGGAAAQLQHAQALIQLLSPPLTLQEILAFVSNDGPYCAHLDVDGPHGAGAILFRVSSPLPVASNYALRLAARVTQRTMVTVSGGGVPRLGFGIRKASLLSDVPVMAAASENKESVAAEGSVLIDERFLADLLTRNHSDGAHSDNAVPTTMSALMVHVIDTHVDHVHDIVTKLEMELDWIELELDKGGDLMKRNMLDDRTFPKMHLDLQRLLQVVSHGEQVFSRVKEKCASKSWFASEDIIALEESIVRLRRLKENLGFVMSRLTTLQSGLDSWQSQQINRKLYYLSVLSIIFLPLSIVTGVFGMNVGGVPWTNQKNPAIQDGFINVMALCGLLLLVLLLCFLFPLLYLRFSAWRTHRATIRSSSFNWRHHRYNFFRGSRNKGYMRL